MRGTNGPMDVITRAEFEDSMKNFPTKDVLVSAVREAIRENLDDLNIDLSAQIEEKVTRSHNILGFSAVKTSDLKDAKNEILATVRRNIGEAIDPLKADFHRMGDRVDKMGDQVDQMGDRIHKMGARIDEMHATFNSVADGHKALDQKLTRLAMSCAIR